MIRGLMFDFDGLVLDTELPGVLCWQEIYQEHGCIFPADAYAKSIGTLPRIFDVYGHLEKQIGRPLDREAMQQRRLERCMEIIIQQAALPGVENYVREAKQRGLKLGVASSSSRNWVAGHLERLDLLSFFDHLSCGDMVTMTKPHPELYHTALASLAIEPHEAIAFEDSPHGVTAAKAAGIFCVAVPNQVTQQLTFAHADLQLSSLAEMTFAELVRTIDDRRM
ncbi:MAG: HAD-IA family hydrolase [Deltaproteobacteria bacterium]|nr:HAD-IA family hydrolase [Deltaproteobacteria bacterium]